MAIAKKAELGSPPPLTYQDVLARDTRKVPDILKSVPRDLGTAPTPASRYTSSEFFKREVEKVFKKTWQFACVDDDVPNAGDTFVYDFLGMSVIVVRQQDHSLKAFKNVCLHRGRKLVTSNGCKDAFRCPYHAFTWNTDGTFKQNPFGWDFPQVDKKNFNLLEVRVESWAGLVFINFDEDAEPLLQQLSPMPEHFKRWRIDECYKAAHVGRIMPANWKACAEAFIESHHVIATHPQFDAFTGHDYTQIDILSDHVTRFITASAASPGTYPEEVDDQRLFELMMSSGARNADTGKGGAKPKLPDGETMRSYSAKVARKALEQKLNDNFDHISDAEALDGIAYDFFPNFHLWGGFKDKITYRFRPIDHENTLLEVMLFAITPKGSPKPPPARMRLLDKDAVWASATELGLLAPVYDQDASNMGPVQEGLRTLGDGDIQFSRYLEARCRNLHRMIDVYLAR